MNINQYVNTQLNIHEFFITCSISGDRSCNFFPKVECEKYKLLTLKLMEESFIFYLFLRKKLHNLDGSCYYLVIYA